MIAKGNEEGIIENSNRPEGKGCIRRGGAFIRSFEDGAMLSGWAPGMRPVELEKDAGMLILPEDYIIIQMHYYQNPDAEKTSRPKWSGTPHNRCRRSCGSNVSLRHERF